MLEFLNENIFFLLVSTILAIIALIIYRKFDKDKDGGKQQLSTKLNLIDSEVKDTINATGNTNTVINVTHFNPPLEEQHSDKSIETLDKRKKLTTILFIDDDTKFKVVNILKKSGWENTSLVKDIGSFDDLKVKEANILFVDVQGVGRALECKDEGLGLALSLVKKYPEKRIIIYSAETKGDRFHEALRKAHSFLAKNAEPYEFQELVEQFSKEIFPNV